MSAPVTIPYQFDVPTMRLIVRGLGKLPYEEVAAVIEAIVTHADAVLNPPEPVKPARASKKKDPAPPAA